MPLTKKAQSYNHPTGRACSRSVRAAVSDGGGDVNARSMVVTRSTYSGSAQHAGRWLGDNASTWKDLRLSIIGRC